MPSTVSPWSVRMARNTPWAEGCCGPMFIVRRSAPPYPISMTLRASGSAIPTSVLLCSLGPGSLPSPHGREGRGGEHDGLHVRQARRALGEEGLPLGLPRQLRPLGRALVEVVEGPHVDHLVELG